MLSPADERSDPHANAIKSRGYAIRRQMQFAGDLGNRSALCQSHEGDQMITIRQLRSHGLDEPLYLFPQLSVREFVVWSVFQSSPDPETSELKRLKTYALLHCAHWVRPLA
jgi:hypothetical protein